MKQGIKIFLIIFTLFSFKSICQEINCKVVMETSNINNNQEDEKYFKSFVNDVTAFMNNRNWTKDFYKNHERINISVFFNVIKRVSEDEFVVNMQIRYTRPIYNSIYNTTILDIKDNNVNFKYFKGQNMSFNYNTFSSNLTSVMAYYAYLILGIDYDSFSRRGGQNFLKIANTIVSVAQNRGYAGWSYEKVDINRYWIINRLTNSPFDKFRDVLYNYHIKGIDLIIDNPDEAQKAILKSLEKLKEVAQEENNKILTNIFFDSKSDEMINIFRNANDDIKNKFKKIANQIYSTYQDKWNSI